MSMAKGGPVRKGLFLLVSALVLGAAAPASAIQCVPYAREISGIDLKGDAWQWWNAASGRYERGRTPRDGAVLVFGRQGTMRYGHVSVVTRVVSPRLVLVDHANWAPVRGAGRGAITTAVPVLDVSAKNDWSQVRVWYHPIKDFGGRVYRADGYVYQPRDPKIPRPMVQQAALKRAAEIYPDDRSLARQSKRQDSPKLESSKDEAAAPKVEEVATQTMAKAGAAAAEPAAVNAAPPSAEGLIRVARHVFRPRHDPAKPESANGLLFN
jgi:CHAP domain.